MEERKKKGGEGRERKEMGREGVEGEVG